MRQIIVNSSSIVNGNVIRRNEGKSIGASSSSLLSQIPQRILWRRFSSLQEEEEQERERDREREKKRRNEAAQLDNGRNATS